MGLYKELQKDYKSNILKITTDVAQYILNTGILFFILGIIITILYWKQFSIFPFFLGGMFFTLAYLKSLKLLTEVKKYNMEILIYLELEKK